MGNKILNHPQWHGPYEIESVAKVQKLTRESFCQRRKFRSPSFEGWKASVVMIEYMCEHYWVSCTLKWMTFLTSCWFRDWSINICDNILFCSGRWVGLLQYSMRYPFSPKVRFRTCSILTCGCRALSVPVRSSFQGRTFAVIAAHFSSSRMRRAKLIFPLEKGQGSCGSDVGAIWNWIDCVWVARPEKWKFKKIDESAGFWPRRGFEHYWDEVFPGVTWTTTCTDPIRGGVF